MHKQVKRSRRNQTDWPYVQNDSGAIEINSPVFRNIQQAERFYLYMKEIISHYPLVSHRNDVGGGGGHIHFGLDFLDHKKHDSFFKFKFHLNFFRDVQNRPYLNWMFNEYFDNQSAVDFRRLKKNESCSKVIFSKDKFKKLYDSYIKLYIDENYISIGGNSQRSSMRINARRINDLFNLSKGFQLITNGEYKTIEVRFFDAKRNWKEVEDHLYFLNAYVKYIYAITKDGREIKANIKDITDINKLVKNDNCIHQFKRLLNTIRLPDFDYMHYVKLNYEKRKKEGYII